MSDWKSMTEEEADKQFETLLQDIQEGTFWRMGDLYATDVRRDEKLRSVRHMIDDTAEGKKLNVSSGKVTMLAETQGLSVVGKEIWFDDPAAFIGNAKLATDVEMFPKIDGNVQINFTFDDLPGGGNINGSGD